MHEDLEEDQEMITPHQFGLLMVDWTNPQKAAQVYVWTVVFALWLTCWPDAGRMMIPRIRYHMLISPSRFWSPCMILIGPVGTLSSPYIWFSDLVIVDEQKTLCQLLGQLQIEPGLDERSIHKLNILLSYHDEVWLHFWVTEIRLITFES